MPQVRQIPGGREMSLTIYLVGPKEGNHKPWLMTGERSVAEKYAEEMGGVVTEKVLSVPTVHLHVKTLQQR